MDRVTNISWRTTSGATLGGFAYEYDAVGRITSRSHALGTNAFDRVCSYDDFDRLASDGDVAYAYDVAGNRMTRTEDGETIPYPLGVGDRLASYGAAASPRPPPPTSCHGPLSSAAPFTLYVADTFHFACGGSKTMFAKSGVPSTFIGNDTILKSFVASPFSGSSPST